MDLDLTTDIGQVTLSNSSNCWTCKLRRKKCDGNRPTCNACAGLHIPCHQSQARPEWMDGGVRQEQMQEEIKCKVKENAHRRRGDHSVNIFPTQNPAGEPSQDSWNPVSQKSSAAHHSPPTRNGSMPAVDVSNTPPSPHSVSTITVVGSPEHGCRWGEHVAPGTKQFGKADTVHIAFYTENLFPFLFPFHHPACGKAWILELLLRSPVIRQATLCQSSYYLSLEQEAASHRSASEVLLDQTNDAFAVLSDALQIIISQGITQHLAGAVRVLTSIMQLHRFEATVMSFENCQAHLNAAVALFQQLLESESEDAVRIACARSSFDGVLNRLGPAISTFGTVSVHVTSAEQTAFRFSSALVVFEDVIASTVLQKPPKLYSYHNSLLVNRFDSTGPAIDLKTVIGCENWVMLHIGEIAALDAWKQTCKREGTLDVMQLVQRATSIKTTLEARIASINTRSASNGENVKPLNLLDAFHTQAHPGTDQIALVTEAWAQAAMAYLFVVVSGWQPASPDIQFHVQRTIDILSQLSPPSLLRTMVWPFSVAGCLVEPDREAHLRGLVRPLQPPSVFGAVHKALVMIEGVWASRGKFNADRDLTSCFRSREDFSGAS
ncbi:hypothetical protein M409DRAFT_15823 [Zasmidium cellare ATCC 36951]|uniref:Zn(2)-C6 fungal-type domain-containing protein n=1 Tax=Zasmidium cellare ATCC 36951 TaxID=1080233 RepID=A0A6A6D345_ZASCE|nr:uncharacterized protein M409DRAFT_15823 [Zasmidium cellare ATCC 36951]KAF2173543.1 hypothetical protein M409DRAFT_15823 [Zasmidium cellare ATCC 36951]